MRILVVDDEPTAGELFEQVICSEGHQVDRCSDGQEAWERHCETPYALVVADWKMPRMTGLELCGKIRRIQNIPYTYFIMVTGMSGKKDFEEAIEGGVDDFITKPFDNAELLARIKVAERVLGIHQRLNRLEGLLPVCMYCRRVRPADTDAWQQLEEYIQERSDARVSSVVCDQCYEAEVKPALDGLSDKDA